jgi:drug/metabolite transporter (DMT)-like permease
MDWKIASIGALLCWGVYAIFGDEAGKIHGEKVSLVFEALAFVLLSLIVISGSTTDFSRVTRNSFVLASLMGLSSAIGFYLLLYALRVSPGNLSLIIVITGAYPLITVLVSYFRGANMCSYQWIGVIFVSIGIILINLPEKIIKMIAS